MDKDTPHKHHHVKDEKRLITAEEVATYSVCPEAWHLNYLKKLNIAPNISNPVGRQLRREWIKKQDLSSQLRRYAKIAYVLLVILVLVVFLLDRKRVLVQKQIEQEQTIEVEQFGP